MNVDEMLRSITAKQLLGWQIYSQVSPFASYRQDWNAARIVKALWDIARDTKKHPNEFNMSDFVVKYGMDAEPKRASAKSVGRWMRDMVVGLKRKN